MTATMGHGIELGKVARVGLGLLAVGAVGLSAAMPLGLGVVALVWALALGGAVAGASVICYKLVKDMVTGAATFGYAPTMAYLAGKRSVKTKKEETKEEKNQKDFNTIN
jgi:hypothetical protein